MPRKKILPEEIQNIVDQVREKEQKEDAKEARELVQKIREERVRNSDYWDVNGDLNEKIYHYLREYNVGMPYQKVNFIQK